MEANKNFNNILLWAIPTLLLLSTFLPIAFPQVYYQALKIIVFVTALYIIYLLFKQKPKQYIIWSIAFILIAIVFNPIKAIMGDKIHFAPDASIIYMANWWIAFRTKRSD